jgi:hypothetical protein
MAGDNPDVAIAVHVDDFDYTCDTFWLPDCFAIQTFYPEMNRTIYFYVLVCGHGWTGYGYLGLWYGLTWPADWQFVNWLSCAQLTIGSIEQPGDWVEQWWEVCIPPLGKPEIAGILGLIPTSPGQVKVIEHAMNGTAQVFDCYGEFDIVLPCEVGNGRAGWATVVGPDLGCNPCPCVGPPCYQPPSGVDRTQWGAVKGLFR